MPFYYFTGRFKHSRCWTTKLNGCFAWTFAVEKAARLAADCDPAASVNACRCLAIGFGLLLYQPHDTFHVIWHMPWHIAAGHGFLSLFQDADLAHRSVQSVATL